MMPDNHPFFELLKKENFPEVLRTLEVEKVLGRFSGRSSLVNHVNYNPSSFSVGDVITDGKLLYQFVQDSTLISDLPGLEPFGDVYPDHWKENTSPGVTDMTTAIAAAIAHSDTLLSNTYLISDTIPVPSNRTLSGKGKNSKIVPDTSTWVRYEPIATAVEKGGFTSGSKPMISNTEPSTGNSNITLKDFEIQGALTGPNHIIHVREVDNLNIENLYTQEGLSAFAILKCTDTKIVGNRVSGFRNGGIDTWEGNKRLLIQGNIIEGTPDNPDGSNIGIFVTAQPTDGTDATNHIAEDVIVSDNIINGGEGIGIWIGGGVTTRGSDEIRRCSVTNNIIKDVEAEGLIVEQGEGVSISGNKFYNIGNHGILARRLGPSGPAVEDLTIESNYFKDVAQKTSASQFISLDSVVNNAKVIDNTGRGSTHDYALYNRGTNTGLTHYGNRWDAGTSGTLNELGVSTSTRPSSFIETTTTWDPPNIVNGAQSSTTVSVTGASIGDSLEVISSSSFSGMMLWGEVTAVDTITLYLTNNTGSNVNSSVRTISIFINKV